MVVHVFHHGTPHWLAIQEVHNVILLVVHKNRGCDHDSIVFRRF